MYMYINIPTLHNIGWVSLEYIPVLNKDVSQVYTIYDYTLVYTRVDIHSVYNM